MYKQFAVVMIVATGIGGCTLGNWNSIYREFSTDSGDSQLVDVKQRSILVQPGKEGRKMVCAEPSPDALSVYASAFAARAEASNTSGAAKEGAGGSVDIGTNESGIMQLRTQSTQLLRDAYYRACEAYLSGAIDQETYDTLIRRLNNQTIAYLAIETIANAPSPEQADALQAQNLDKLRRDLAAARTKREGLVTQRDAANDEAAKATTDEEKRTTKTKVDGLNTQIASLDEEIRGLERTITAGVKALAVAAERGHGPSGPQAALELAQTVLLADYTPQNCYAHLRLAEGAKAPNSDEIANSTDYCRRVLSARAREADSAASLQQAYAEQSLVASRWFMTNCAQPSKDPKIRETCRVAAEKIIKGGQMQVGSNASTADHAATR